MKKIISLISGILAALVVAISVMGCSSPSSENEPTYELENTNSKSLRFTVYFSENKKQELEIFKTQQSGTTQYVISISYVYLDYSGNFNDNSFSYAVLNNKTHLPDRDFDSTEYFSFTITCNSKSDLNAYIPEDEVWYMKMVRPDGSVVQSEISAGYVARIKTWFNNFQ